MTTPTPRRTIVEQLDAASDGKEFGAAINGLFSALETLMADDDQDDDEDDDDDDDDEQPAKPGKGVAAQAPNPDVPSSLSLL